MFGMAFHRVLICECRCGTLKAINDDLRGALDLAERIELQELSSALSKVS